MELKLPTEFDTSILNNCNLSNLGRTLCDRLNCKMTDYGIVTSEGGQIFATVTPEEDEPEESQDEEPEQEIEGPDFNGIHMQQEIVDYELHKFNCF